MNDDLWMRVQIHVIDHANGGCTGIELIIDEAIDEGHISPEEYRDNESSIHAMIDQQIFECTCCNWVWPISEMSDKNDDWECNDCND